VLVGHVAVERHAVGLLRHVLADEPHARHALVGLHARREVGPPSAGVEERGVERQPEGQQLHVVAPDEAAIGSLRASSVMIPAIVSPRYIRTG
jgi:hypothetical protein